jgi:hypothetical protein
MTVEQDLYDKFVKVLLDKLASGSECAPKDLEIIQRFIAQQGIQADPIKHRDLNKLKNSLDLPFDEIEDEAPLKRVK